MSATPLTEAWRSPGWPLGRGHFHGRVARCCPSRAIESRAPATRKSPSGLRRIPRGNSVQIGEVGEAVSEPVAEAKTAVRLKSSAGRTAPVREPACLKCLRPSTRSVEDTEDLDGVVGPSGTARCTASEESPVRASRHTARSAQSRVVG